MIIFQYANVVQSLSLIFTLCVTRILCFAKCLLSLKFRNFDEIWPWHNHELCLWKTNKQKILTVLRLYHKCILRINRIWLHDQAFDDGGQVSFLFLERVVYCLCSRFCHRVCVIKLYIALKFTQNRLSKF